MSDENDEVFDEEELGEGFEEEIVDGDDVDGDVDVKGDVDVDVDVVHVGVDYVVRVYVIVYVCV